MERLHGDIRDFKNYDFELNEKDTKELHRNITIKKQRDEMLEMLKIMLVEFKATDVRTGAIKEDLQQLIKQATEL